jgi:hypothetical protein
MAKQAKPKHAASVLTDAAQALSLFSGAEAERLVEYLAWLAQYHRTDAEADSEPNAHVHQDIPVLFWRMVMALTSDDEDAYRLAEQELGSCNLCWTHALRYATATYASRFALQIGGKEKATDGAMAALLAELPPNEVDERKT